MKFLVTGANGYIGSHVVRILLNDGHDVAAADIRTDCIDQRAEIYNTDIFSGDENMYEELGSPDVCIHLAWRNGFVHNADSHITDLPAHYIFLRNMLDKGLPQLVVMGSMHEIGYWEGAIDENTPARPRSPYGISKNALRQLLETYTEDKDVCFQWLRGFYITGDDFKNNSIFSKLIAAAAEGKKTFPFTSGKNKYDFITVDELARQIAAASEQSKIKGIINCCTGKPLSLGEKVEGFIRDNGLNIKLDYGAYPDRKYDSPGIWGDPEKINTILREKEGR